MTNKIFIKVDQNELIVSQYDKDSNPSDINKTNVIDIKKLKFSEDYIEKNEEIISSYLKLICLKNNINEVRIITNNIAALILKILKNIDCIKKVTFQESNTLNYLACDMLINNKNITDIDVYNIPEVLYDQFKNKNLSIRNEFLFTSDFMEDNHIKNYYDLVNKKIIYIKNILSLDDFNDLDYFFKENRDCQKVIFNYYNKNLLNNILDIIKSHKKNKITLIIQENTSNIAKLKDDRKYLDNLLKENKIRILSNRNKMYKIFTFFLKIFIFIIIIFLIFIHLVKN